MIRGLTSGKRIRHAIRALDRAAIRWGMAGIVFGGKLHYVAKP